jgi:uncharacterized membrane protein YgdD (TMEM256/DUF423 family)
MTRTFTFWGALFAGLAVAAGAFGAHALKAILAVEMLAVFETAARYQMYHALALLFIGLADVRGTSRPLRAAGWMFVLGIGLFSGSLYAVALSGVRWLGAVTPLGGAAFIVGWVLVIAGCCRHRAEM